MTIPEIIPAEALINHTAILGKTGSGKTVAAKSLIVEPLLDAGKRVCIIDPTGVWWGLRSSADGTGDGYPVVIFGGRHADVPLAEHQGELVAQLVTGSTTSTVIDTSLMRVGQRTRFFTDFAEALMRLNRAPLYLIIDEAHEFIPQRGVQDPQSAAMVSAGNSLLSGGRVLGLRMTLLSQRPAKLHKDSLSCIETLVAMRVTAPQDRKAIAEWVDGHDDPKAAKNVIASLSTLSRGEGWVWAAEQGILARHNFPMCRTFNSSATPTDDQPLQDAELRAVDLADIRKLMEQPPAPVATKAGKAGKEKSGDEHAEPQRQRILELTAEVEDLQAALARSEQASESAYERGIVVGRQLLADVVLKVILGQDDNPPLPFDTPPAAIPEANLAPVVMPTHQAPKPKKAAKVAAGLSNPQQRILDALAQLKCFGLAAPQKNMVAAFAAASPRSSGFANNLSSLRTGGYIYYPENGCVGLTEQGAKVANTAIDAPTLDDIHNAWLDLISGPQQRIVRVLIRFHPRSIEREQLANLADASFSSSGYANNLSALRTLGLLDYPERGMVVATDLLFPKGAQK